MLQRTKQTLSNLETLFKNNYKKLSNNETVNNVKWNLNDIKKTKININTGNLYNSISAEKINSNSYVIFTKNIEYASYVNERTKLLVANTNDIINIVKQEFIDDLIDALNKKIKNIFK